MCVCVYVCMCVSVCLCVCVFVWLSDLYVFRTCAWKVLYELHLGNGGKIVIFSWASAQKSYTTTHKQKEVKSLKNQSKGNKWKQGGKVNNLSGLEQKLNTAWKHSNGSKVPKSKTLKVFSNVKCPWPRWSARSLRYDAFNVVVALSCCSEIEQNLLSRSAHT